MRRDKQLSTHSTTKKSLSTTPQRIHSNTPSSINPKSFTKPKRSCQTFVISVTDKCTSIFSSMQLHLFLASVFKASNENGHVTSESSSVPSPTMPLLTFSSRTQQEQLRASGTHRRICPVLCANNGSCGFVGRRAS